MDHPLLWALFAVLVAVTMVVDLGLLKKHQGPLSTREALGWTGVWVAVGLGFCGVLAIWVSHQSATEYLACYLTEYALSVDNIFVFLVIFTFFAVPLEHQRRVLFWGIFGAMAMRGVFLFFGVALVERFHWTVWILGAILVLTGIKLLFQKDAHVDPAKNPILKLARRLLPVTTQYEGGVEGRNSDIEAGSGRDWESLVADVRSSAWRLDEVFAAQDRWDLAMTNSAGEAVPHSDLPSRRLREVVVHHADLGDDGYTPADWPADYVREELRRMEMVYNARQPMGISGLPDAALLTTPLERLCWLLGRGEIDGLEPAGVF